VAWVLRDYPHVEYIPDVAAARLQPIALLPISVQPPDLGSSYVGQQFTITTGWDYRALRPAEFLAWWTQRNTRTVGVPIEAMVLWLRQDVYDGAQPFTPGQ
jgi:hypothetical protein